MSFFCFSTSSSSAEIKKTQKTQKLFFFTHPDCFRICLAYHRVSFHLFPAPAVAASCSRIIRTIPAFCDGLERQTTTEEQRAPTAAS